MSSIFISSYRNKGVHTKITESIGRPSQRDVVQGYTIHFTRITGGVPNIVEVTKIINKVKVHFIFISKDVDSLFRAREQKQVFETIRWRLRDVAGNGEPPKNSSQLRQFAGSDIAIKVRMVEGDELFQAAWWDDMSVLEKYMGDLNENQA